MWRKLCLGKKRIMDVLLVTCFWPNIRNPPLHNLWCTSILAHIARAVHEKCSLNIGYSKNYESCGMSSQTIDIFSLGSMKHELLNMKNSIKVISLTVLIVKVHIKDTNKRLSVLLTCSNPKNKILTRMSMHDEGGTATYSDCSGDYRDGESSETHSFFNEAPFEFDEELMAEAYRKRRASRNR